MVMLNHINETTFNAVVTITAITVISVIMWFLVIKAAINRTSNDSDDIIEL